MRDEERRPDPKNEAATEHGDANNNTAAGALLASLVGRELPGACADCAAYATVDRDRLGIWHLFVRHDDGCPFFRGLS